MEIKITTSWYLFISKTVLYSGWGIFSIPGIRKFFQKFNVDKGISQTFFVFAL